MTCFCSGLQETAIFPFVNTLKHKWKSMHNLLLRQLSCPHYFTSPLQLIAISTYKNHTEDGKNHGRENHCMLCLTTKCPPPSETNAFSEPGEWFTHMLDRFRQSVKMSQAELLPPPPITFPARRVAFFPDSVTLLQFPIISCLIVCVLQSAIFELY